MPELTSDRLADLGSRVALGDRRRIAAWFRLRGTRVAGEGVGHDLQVLVLQSELAIHDKHAEIERDLANAPTREALAAAPLTPEQSTIVENYLDLKLRVKEGEAATALRKAQIAQLLTFKAKIHELT